MIYLVRHGESVGNAGGRTDTTVDTPLTEEGWRQARNFASGFKGKPDLIVCSPYLRARQTARPFIEKFPDTSVEEWPVQEFTFLDEDLCRGTTHEERCKMRTDYTSRNDWNYVSGKGAESFNQFLQRVDDMIERLGKMDKNKLVMVFTHGHFIKAVLLRLRSEPVDMAKVFEVKSIDNAAMVEIEI